MEEWVGEERVEAEETAVGGIGAVEENEGAGMGMEAKVRRASNSWTLSSKAD